MNLLNLLNKKALRAFLVKILGGFWRLWPRQFPISGQIDRGEAGALPENGQETGRVAGVADRPKAATETFYPIKLHGKPNTTLTATFKLAGARQTTIISE